MKNFISLVPIREDSKGLRKKNILKIEGIPLYLRTVNQALRITDKCIINTDIESVLQKKDFNENIIIYKREKKFAKDATPMDLVLKDMFEKVDLVNKYIILLQATSPLRKDEDILNALNLFRKGNYSMVMSVKKVDSSFLKYGYDSRGNFIPFAKNYLFKNRQYLPKVLSPNGAIYIFSVREFLKKNKMPEKNIGYYEMPSDRSIDIDKKEDLNKIRKIFRTSVDK